MAEASGGGERSQAAQLLSIALAAAMPVAKVCLLAAVGLLLARRGTLDKHAQQRLALLVFQVFAPALTFSHLVESVSLETLQHWWPLWFSMVAGIGFGACCGTVSTRLLGVQPELRPLVIAATAFGNVGNLPLVLVSSVCQDSSSVLAKQLGTRCSSLGIAYVTFGMAMATLVVFGVSLPLLRPKGNAKMADSSLQLTSKADGRTLLAHGTAACVESDPTCNSAQGSLQAAGLPVGAPDATLHALELASVRHAGQHGGDGGAELSLVGPLVAASTGAGWQPEGSEGGQRSVNELDDGHSGLGAAARLGAGEATCSWSGRGRGALNGVAVVEVEPEAEAARDWHGHVEETEDEAGALLGGERDRAASRHADCLCAPYGVPALRRRCGAAFSAAGDAVRWVGRCVNWRDVATPSTTAAVLAIVIGCVHSVQSLLVGEGAPLALLQGAASELAGATIPCMMLTLGATFADGPGRSSMPRSMMVSVCGCRLLLQPAFGVCLTLLLEWLQLLPPDPMAKFVMLLQQTVPTAIVLQTIACMLGNGEAEIGALLFWQYIGSIVTTPAWLMLYFRMIA